MLVFLQTVSRITESITLAHIIYTPARPTTIVHGNYSFFSLSPPEANSLIGSFLAHVLTG